MNESSLNLAKKILFSLARELAMWPRKQDKIVKDVL